MIGDIATDNKGLGVYHSSAQTQQGRQKRYKSKAPGYSEYAPGLGLFGQLEH